MAKGSANKDIKDVYIALMGVTGAGKSSFIATCSGQDVAVGHDLTSCTTDVEDVAFMYNPQLRVHLVDTPGFDDTTRSDVEVLQDIAAWLAGSFASGTKLNGIIFLHRISDPRMTRSARRNLLMFKKLCGANSYKSVVFATTMWSKVDPAEGTERERQLTEKSEFWGTMYRKGSRVFRYHNTIESAEEIINYILSLDKKIVLNIQDEIVNKKLEIEDTSAAVELNAEIIRERKKHQEELAMMKEQMEEAIEMRDMELQEIFQEEIGELQSKIEQGTEEQRKLTQSLAEVQKRKETELEAFKQQIRRDQQELQRKIEKGVEEQRKLTQSLAEVQKRKETELEAFKQQTRRDQQEVHQRYQRELEEQRRLAKEQEALLKESYEAEVRRLAEEQKIRVREEQKREEEFRIQQQEAEWHRAVRDETARRALEHQRRVAVQEQQAALERHRRETEIYREETERMERQYLADVEERRRNDKAMQREMREEEARRQQQLQESLQRKASGGFRNALRNLAHELSNKIFGRPRQLSFPRG
ncbi:P-loop containing nucleoside triphosphate hydrolase protein [Chaetomium fimeti]|uniref:P-loop containing nucleoside triphosphate hydrolase protein n=1 Tax=Chaetomium fimeti TaxID=1854472 RepID=A0AAE0HLC6_9PEZI|nr:P-loop containing nucleoside triphosphate hydrolase protein [Chaetomium fimeti]